MTLDFAKLKVEDIKQMLVDDLAFSLESLDTMDIKGKSQWVEFYTKMVDSLPTTQSVKFEEESEEEKNTLQDYINKTKDIPEYYSPEWQDYVMKQFSKEELIDGKYPNVNGLRRVVELLLGEIVACGPCDVRATMDPTGLGKAVVVYEINIEWKLNCGPYIDLMQDKQSLPIKTFKAVGASYPDNTDDTYAVFPEAIAETRAEGRALRRALRLGVVCSDELTKKNTAEIIRQKIERGTTGNWEENDAITDNQQNSIKIMCDRLNIDFTKFINSGSKTYNHIGEVSRQTAANMIKRLNEFQNNNSIQIPTNILKG